MFSRGSAQQLELPRASLNNFGQRNAVPWPPPTNKSTMSLPKSTLQIMIQIPAPLNSKFAPKNPPGWNIELPSGSIFSLTIEGSALRGVSDTLSKLYQEESLFAIPFSAQDVSGKWSSFISSFCSDVRDPLILNYSKAHRPSSHELSLGGSQLKFLVYPFGVRGYLPNSSVVLPQRSLSGVLGLGLIYLFLTTIQCLLSFASTSVELANWLVHVCGGLLEYLGSLPSTKYN
jgi:hypothetical protein